MRSSCAQITDLCTLIHFNAFRNTTKESHRLSTTFTIINNSYRYICSHKYGWQHSQQPSFYSSSVLFKYVSAQWTVRRRTTRIVCLLCATPRWPPAGHTPPPSPYCAAVLHFTYPIQVDHSAILVCTSDALNKGFSSFSSVLSQLALDNGILLFSNTSDNSM